MSTAIELKKYNNIITGQRNLFLVLTIFLAITTLLLALKIFSIKEKIIMVPGINKELTVEGNIISDNYLEESALLYASMLLDLTPGTIEYKKNIKIKLNSN